VRVLLIRPRPIRLLSEVKIEDMSSLGHAIQVLHQRYAIPHIVITSVSLQHPDHPEASLSVVGSTMTSDRRARPFKIVFPAIDCYFSGTGDMFAALTVVRMREAVWNTPAGDNGNTLSSVKSWRSDDSVDAVDLPLAKAVEKVLASMHEVLTKTSEAMHGGLKRRLAGDGLVNGAADEKKVRLLKSKAAELRLVRHVESLRSPKVQFRAVRM